MLMTANKGIYIFIMEMQVILFSSCKQEFELAFILPNFHSCFFNSTETKKNVSFFLIQESFGKKSKGC